MARSIPMNRAKNGAWPVILTGVAVCATVCLLVVAMPRNWRETQTISIQNNSDMVLLSEATYAITFESVSSDIVLKSLSRASGVREVEYRMCSIDTTMLANPDRMPSMVSLRFVACKNFSSDVMVKLCQFADIMTIEFIDCADLTRADAEILRMSKSQCLTVRHLRCPELRGVDDPPGTNPRIVALRD